MWLAAVWRGRNLQTFGTLLEQRQLDSGSFAGRSPLKDRRNELPENEKKIIN